MWLERECKGVGPGRICTIHQCFAFCFSNSMHSCGLVVEYMVLGVLYKTIISNNGLLYRQDFSKKIKWPGTRCLCRWGDVPMHAQRWDSLSPKH